MKTGIIGLPQVGKTSLFRILTRAHLSAQANPREAHIGVARVPDDRLDRLAALYHPKKLAHTSVEYVDVGAIGQDALKESAYIGHLRQVDALAHVVRVFDEPAIAHVGEIDPLRDIKNVEFDLMVSDLGQVEKRLERLEKDLKKMKTAELEKEFELLRLANAHLGAEKPLREMEMSPEDKKRIRGFMFLSEKPIFYVLNIGESAELGKELEEAVSKYKLSEIASRPHAAATAICGKVEADVQALGNRLPSACRRDRHLRQGGSRTVGNERCRRGRIPLQLRFERERPGSPHPHHLQAARPDLVFHRWRRRMPRLGDSRPYPRAGSRRGHPLRSGEALHPRRNHPLGSTSRSGFGSQRARQGHAPPGRQGLHRAGWRCHARPPQRLIPPPPGKARGEGAPCRRGLRGSGVT